MCRIHCQKLEVAVATVNEAMAVPHGAVMRLARQQFLLAGIGEHSGLALEEIHYLAVGIMAVIAYRGPWRERSNLLFSSTNRRDTYSPSPRLKLAATFTSKLLKSNFINANI